MLRITDKIKLVRDNTIHDAAIAVIQADLPQLSSLTNVHLHENEKLQLDSYEFEKRKLSYSLGRIATKIALKELVSNLDTAKCWIEKGVFEQPVLHTNDANLNLQCSLTHSDNMSVAVVFPSAHPLAVDLEKIDSSKIAAINSKLVDAEKELCFEYSHYPMHTILWTLKEALSKAIKCGLTVPFELLQIDKVEKTESGFSAIYTNFFQYKANSFILENDFVVSLVYPKHTTIDFNPVFGKLQSTLQPTKVQSASTIESQ